MIQETSIIIDNQQVGPHYHRISLSCASAYENSRPGQFVMVHLPGLRAPLLRRPFSIHQLIFDKNQIKGLVLLFKIAGPTTRALAQLRPGDPLDLLGPLGNHFTLPQGVHRVYMAAGGIGVAPMLFLKWFLERRGIHKENITLFLGGRGQDDLVCKDEFHQQEITVKVSTDDGSEGEACLLTDPLETATKNHPPDMIYACGPTGMLKCVAGIAETYSVACQISVETLMACGVGACLGCAVSSLKDPSKYLHACIDGPVFNVDTLALDSL
jgi:dihydroorotate dehydrogenase electron transfer subunit